MNKMIKGAAVAGLGVALLLGGAGTLAVWNDTAESTAGSIVAGNLDVEATAGAWTSSLSGPVADISSYRVIPGESLTFTQDLTVVLEGDELEATLAVAGAASEDGFEPGTVAVTTEFSDATTAEAIPAVLTDSTTVKAVTTFEFLESTTDQQSTNASYNFAGVSYVLTQVAP